MFHLLLNVNKYSTSIHLSSNTALAILRGLFAFIFRHFLNLLKGWLGGLGWGWSGDEVDKMQRSWQLIISRQNPVHQYSGYLEVAGHKPNIHPILSWVTKPTFTLLTLEQSAQDLVTIMSWQAGHQSTDSNERPIQSLLF